MSHAADADLPDHQSRLLATRVREELARRRWSRQRLADKAGISISTLEKALAGQRPFTLATLIRLEGALGVSLRPAETPTGQASDALGAYSRAAVSWLIGDYLTLRPSFEDADAIYGYRTAIAWDETASCLTFHETTRLDADFNQTGQISLPNQSGHIHLITNDHGQFRLITLGRATITGDMYGLLSTLQSGPGGRLTPVAAPIVLSPLRKTPEARFGRIGRADQEYTLYRTRLDRAVDESFVRLIGR